MASYLKRLAVLAASGALLVGCSGGAPVEVTHLTIVTTHGVVDQATSLAVAEYIADQGTEVEIEQHDDQHAVFAALDADTAPDHEMVAVVTAHQDHDAQEPALLLPEDLDIISQAPAELGLTAAASTITAAKFSRVQQESEDQDLAAACAELTWFHAQTPADATDRIVAALAELGCEPSYESADAVDPETYDELTARLSTEPHTVAMLYSLDPAFADQGLTTLDLETDAWPRSNLVAVSNSEVAEPLVQQFDAVLDVLDSEAATDLLRGYHDARVSQSDLQYDVDNAMRYWLAGHDLVDQDTVTDSSSDRAQ